MNEVEIATPIAESHKKDSEFMNPLVGSESIKTLKQIQCYLGLQSEQMELQVSENPERISDAVALNVVSDALAAAIAQHENESVRIDTC